MNNLNRPEDIVLIGIDGGATKVSGWLIELDVKSGLFSMGNVNIERKYMDYEGYTHDFTPVDLNTQLGELKTGIQLQEAEKKQAEFYKKASVDLISELLNTRKDKRALVGIGMPGLKTGDLRGIAVLANGPRMPDYSDYVEEELKQRGLVLGAPIAHLGSDADYCGLGEEYSETGLFRNVDNAYYLGGGTGVADAMKLHGELVRFDNAKSWIAKAWEMLSEKSRSFEFYTSASGIQKLYSHYSKISVPDLNKNHIYPLQILDRALENEEAAFLTIRDLSDQLALLLFERITTIYSGWSDIFSFVNPAKEKPSADHQFKGTLLNRIIIGQRLGDLVARSKGTELLCSEVKEQLAGLIQKTGDKELIPHFVEGDTLREGILRTSKLREAPALGAGVDAFLSHKKY